MCPLVRSPLEADYGELIGVTRGRLRRTISPRSTSPLVPVMKAIREKYLVCCGQQPAEVRKCVMTDCSIWPPSVEDGKAASPAASDGKPDGGNNRPAAPASQTLVAMEFGAVLLSNVVGFGLSDELRVRFSRIATRECFLGIAFAWAMREDDRVGAQMELGMLRNRLKACG